MLIGVECREAGCSDAHPLSVDKELMPGDTLVPPVICLDPLCSLPIVALLWLPFCKIRGSRSGIPAKELVLYRSGVMKGSCIYYFQLKLLTHID